MQVTLSRTPHRTIHIKLHIPPDYPAAACSADLESATLSPDLLARLSASCASIATASRGAPHAAAVAQHVAKLVDTSRLAPAFDDLAAVRNLCAETACELQHAHQSSGRVAVKLRAGDYVLDLALSVSDGYPAEPLAVDVTAHNLPEASVAALRVRLVELAARRAEFRMADTDVLGASARAGAGAASESKAERLALAGKQTVTSFNKGQVRSDPQPHPFVFDTSCRDAAAEGEVQRPAERGKKGRKQVQPALKSLRSARAGRGGTRSTRRQHAQLGPSSFVSLTEPLRCAGAGRGSTGACGGRAREARRRRCSVRRHTQPRGGGAAGVRLVRAAPRCWHLCRLWQAAAASRRQQARAGAQAHAGALS